MSRTRLRSKSVRRHRRKKRSEFRCRHGSAKLGNPAAHMPVLDPMFDAQVVVAAVNKYFQKIGRFA